jgi:predicted nucleotidyltransferase
VFGSAVKGLFDAASSDLNLIMEMTGQQELTYARHF